MSLIKKFNYVLNKNYQDIVLFKNHFINKLNWDNDQYERIKEDTFVLAEESFILIKQFDEKQFWLLTNKS